MKYIDNSGYFIVFQKLKSGQECEIQARMWNASRNVEYGEEYTILERMWNTGFQIIGIIETFLFSQAERDISKILEDFHSFYRLFRLVLLKTMV